MKLIFQLCHLRLHQDWARVKETEKSIPRILENVRVRICCKLLFLHSHPSCSMFPCVWGEVRDDKSACIGWAQTRHQMRWGGDACFRSLYQWWHQGLVTPLERHFKESHSATLLSDHNQHQISYRDCPLGEDLRCAQMDQSYKFCKTDLTKI